MKKVLIVSFLTFLVIQNVISQEINLTKSDSVIFQAMNDEMSRSMKEYKNPKAGSFFYIMYKVFDYENMSISAELGCLLNSHRNTKRDWSYRAMLGDYNCNDENFIGSSNNYDYSRNMTIGVPIDDDYLGIRRSLWSITDMAFKNCVKTYIDKKDFFKENPLKQSGLPDYTKADSLTYLKNSNVAMLEQKKAEDFVKKMSIIFRNYDKIAKSTVFFNQIKLNLYILSTEGVMCKIPLDFSMLTVNVQSKNTNDENSFNNESITFYDENPLNLLAKSEKIIISSKKLAEYIIRFNELEEIKESYNGPVILSDNASSKFFYQSLFASANNLCAEREPVYEKSKTNFQTQPRFTLEEKIGKKVIPTEFTISCKPKLKQFNNKILLGATLIDIEAVIPPDSVDLIKNGELISLLHDRIPTVSSSVSNGHKRIGVYSDKLGPSNLFVNYSNGKEKKILKSKLIELCKDNNLDFGIEIRSLDETADESPYVYYQIMADGKEKIIKPMSFPQIDFKTINKVKDCTSKVVVSNILLGENEEGLYFEGMFNQGISGCFSSFIVPASVLIKEMEISKLEDFVGYK